MSSNELIVNTNDTQKRVMYYIKTLLLSNNEINVVSGIKGAPISARACEALVRLNYTSYGDIKTNTTVDNNRRKTTFSIKLIKTKDFDKLYKENEEKKKEFQKENEKNETQKEEKTTKK